MGICAQMNRDDESVSLLPQQDRWSCNGGESVRGWDTGKGRNVIVELTAVVTLDLGQSK